MCLNTIKCEYKKSRKSIDFYEISSFYHSWWRWGGSNPWPRTCEARALPAELHPHKLKPPLLATAMAGVQGLEPWALGFGELVISSIESSKTNKSWSLLQPLADHLPTLAKNSGIFGYVGISDILPVVSLKFVLQALGLAYIWIIILNSDYISDKAPIIILSISL